ncbi:hypothetical protein SAMN05444159_6848 [Bradyrhizobium lablabi]|uniref:Uncharacterized protein n=1 Tax=Bradyrhizobium lablabi TaxID=722472 RepID=A0A1M7DKB2_9BRAD|nr:hypothetical protein [Bradyrhizobium lablabi]SHL79920.1 hypothetical protein SAMN05444159_6848 [Bradyrhizobium lablabi]
MTYLMGRSARIGFATVVAAIVTAGFSGNALAAHKGHRHVHGTVYESRAQLVSQPPAQLGPMRYYGGPKSPMWR